jgi:hypothetical protein
MYNYLLQITDPTGDILLLDVESRVPRTVEGLTNQES